MVTGVHRLGVTVVIGVVVVCALGIIRNILG